MQSMQQLRRLRRNFPNTYFDIFPRSSVPFTVTTTVGVCFVFTESTEGGTFAYFGSKSFRKQFCAVWLNAGRTTVARMKHRGTM